MSFQSREVNCSDMRRGQASAADVYPLGLHKIEAFYFTLDVNCGRRSSLLLIVIVRVIKLDAQRSID